MEFLEAGKLLEYGAHGLLAIALIIAWYERREMRKDQFELIKLVMVAHPEAAPIVSEKLSTKVVKAINGHASERG